MLGFSRVLAFSGDLYTAVYDWRDRENIMALVVSDRDSLLDFYNVRCTTHSFANYRPLFEVKLHFKFIGHYFTAQSLHLFPFTYFQSHRIDVTRLFIYITLYLLFCNS